MEPLSTFAILYKPGPKWLPNKPVWEQPLREHGDYMKQLWSKGILKMGGPFEDSTGGLAVVQAKAAAEAQGIVNVDPAVTSGVFVATIHPWMTVDWPNYGKSSTSGPQDSR